MIGIWANTSVHIHKRPARSPCLLRTLSLCGRPKTIIYKFYRQVHDDQNAVERRVEKKHGKNVKLQIRDKDLFTRKRQAGT